MNGVRGELNDIMDSLAAPPSAGAVLRIDSKKPEFHYHQSRGLFARGMPKPLLPDDGFRIASMSKTFTGTLVMQLVEQGRLSFDAPLGEFLDVSAMPVMAGHDKTEITIERLLQHRTGFNDFAMGRDWARRVWRNPARFHPPAETLAWAFENGESLHAPGEKFEYSDTNYVALGLVIEKVTGSAWGDLCRRHIFEPACMTHTWLEGYESPRSTLSHTYFGDSDALAIHGSVDWAAGGHVSTCEDLASFLEHLMRGDLYANGNTLSQMIAGGDNGIGGEYGAGISTRPFGQRTAIGHSGFWGSFMFWVPDLEMTVTGTVNQMFTFIETLSCTLFIIYRYR